MDSEPKRNTWGSVEHCSGKALAMRFFTSLVSLSLFAVAAVNAACLPRTVEKYNGDTSGLYIVKFEDGISRSSVLAGIEHGVNITHDWELINGFAGYYSTLLLAC